MEQKPISIILNDAKKTIYDAINSTGLDISILHYVLKGICNDVENAAKSKYLSDLASTTQKKEENDAE